MPRRRLYHLKNRFQGSISAYAVLFPPIRVVLLLANRFALQLPSDRSVDPGNMGTPLLLNHIYVGNNGGAVFAHTVALAELPASVGLWCASSLVYTSPALFFMRTAPHCDVTSRASPVAKCGFRFITPLSYDH